MASMSTDDLNKYLTEYMNRFNFYLSVITHKVQNFRDDQFIALGISVLGLILIIIAIIIW